MSRIFYSMWVKPACCVSKISSDGGCQSKETGVGMEVRLLSLGARGFFSRRFATRLFATRLFAAQFCRPQREKKPLAPRVTVGQLALTKSPWWGSDKKANLVKQKYDPLLLWNCQAITYFGRLLLNWPSSVAFLSQPNTHTIVDFRLVSHVREKDQNEFLWVVMKQKLIFNGLKLKSRITFVCFKRKGLVLLMFNKARFRFFF